MSLLTGNQQFPDPGVYCGHHGGYNNVLVIYGARSKYGADMPMAVVGIVMKVLRS